MGCILAQGEHGQHPRKQYNGKMDEHRDSPRPPTDYRAFRRRTDRNVALAVVLSLVGGGGTAIALVYGGGAAILGLACLLAGAGLLGVVWLILTLLERWANR
jgi:hypothetical protein